MGGDGERGLISRLLDECEPPLAEALEAAAGDDGMIGDLDVVHIVVTDADDLTLRALGGAVTRIRRRVSEARAADAATAILDDDDDDQVPIPLGRLLAVAGSASQATGTSPQIAGVHLLLALLTSPALPSSRLLAGLGVHMDGLRSVTRRVAWRSDW